jgi:subtilase family serine protease
VKLEGISRFLFPPALAVLLAMATVASAQNGQLQHLCGHVPGAIGRFHLKPIGRMPPGQRLSVAIGLPMRNSDGFHQLLEQIYDPASPEFHQYLTPGQITDRFGPAEQDYDAVIAFAKTNGLQIARTHHGRTLLTVEGTVADIEKTFHVTMWLYRHPTEARTFYAPDTEPSVDLGVPLSLVCGLDNYFLPRPSGRPGEGLAVPGAKSGGGSGPNGVYQGQDFRTAYVPGTSLTGAGQSVGLLELDGYYTNDILSYEAQAGLPNVVITNVLVDGATGTPDNTGGNVGEVSLDMEMVISMAPGISRLIVYETPNSGLVTWLDALTQMQEDNSAKQLSSSWFIPFEYSPVDTTYEKFAMQGQSFFQSSGDDLAYHYGVGEWADDPYITVVGGTSLSTDDNGSWLSETVWNNGDGVNGSGGGVSSTNLGNYPIPSWQKGINMTTNGGSTTNRNIPDVSMLADYAWVIWNNGTSNWWWGTSISAPLWAGFTALANQQAASRSEPPLGFLNPALYAIGSGPLYSSCFHDITSGNNTNSRSLNLYSAVPGYDLCTGLGTPDGINLINILTQTPHIYSTTRNFNGSITLSILCVSASTNVIFTATNLVPPMAWKAIWTNVADSAGTWQFIDSNAPNYKMRFYRIQSYPSGR